MTNKRSISSHGSLGKAGEEVNSNLLEKGFILKDVLNGRLLLGCVRERNLGCRTELRKNSSPEEKGGGEGSKGGVLTSVPGRDADPVRHISTD